MNRHNIGTVIAALSLLAVFFAGCSSVTPVSGTFVGNPDVTAAARQAFKVMQTGDHWCVSSYIPGGYERLDPNTVVSGPTQKQPGPMLAKTTGAGVETLLVYDTLFRYDTATVTQKIPVRDTNYVNDTIGQTRMVADTLDTIIGADVMQVVSWNSITDSFYIRDTVITVDTISSPPLMVITTDTIMAVHFIQMPDSIYLGSGYIDTNGTTIMVPVDSSAMPIYVFKAPQFVGMSIRPATGVSYQFVSSVAGSDTLLISYVPADLDNVTTIPPITDLVSKEKSYTTADGTVIAERYADNDGDGFLYKTKRAGPPAASYVTTITKGTDSQTSSILFNAGADNSFASVIDNQVLSMFRMTTGFDGGEVARLVIDTLVDFDETAQIVVDRQFDNDTVQNATCTYTILRDPDSAASFDGRLVSVRENVTFRYGIVRSVDLCIQLADTIEKGETPARALISAIIEMENGEQTRLMNGAMDMETGVIEATYIVNGKSQTITVDEEGTVVPYHIDWFVP